MRKICALLLPAILVLNGCATTYTGEGPDFSLKGAEAKAEIRKFTIDPAFSQHGADVYRMGPERTAYWRSSLEPMISEVSPAAMQTIETVKWWQLAQLTFLAAAVGILISPNYSWSSLSGPYYAVIGLSIGAGVYGNIVAGDAADQYNRDLEQKFAPQLSLRFPY